MSAIYFILLLGALIFFHELGHFLLARACGIRVLEFSIGFGPRIASFERGGTEYRIGALPLGGYVRMLGADPNEEVPAELAADAFGAKPLWKRSLVILAGPAFNLILPFIVYFFLFSSVGKVEPAALGTLEPGGVAEKAGLLPGDVVTAIDGEHVDGWWELERIVSRSAGKTLRVDVRRGDEQLQVSLTPAAVTEHTAAELGLSRQVGRIQIALSYRKPIVAVDPGSEAEKAGLRSWDRIVAVDGAPVERYEEAVLAIERSVTAPRLHVLRQASLPDRPNGALELATLAPAVQVTLPGGRPVSALGLRSAEWVVYDVQPGTPAARAGLKSGDEIQAVDGKRFSVWALLRRELADNPTADHVLTVQRPGQSAPMDLTVRLVETVEKGDFNTDVKRVVFGATNRSGYGTPARIANEARLAYASYRTWTETARVFTLTAASLAGLFTGQVSFKQMGGPIFIYEVASKTQEEGWGYFFNVMVWLSISLGLINLVPIPLLDGGHLLFFLIEAVKRRPVSLRTRQIASYIGFCAIILLMVLVFKNDIQRNWDSVVSFFQ